MTWTTAGPPPAVPGFLIGARLGVGSTGSVWRAMAVTGGPEVAIKVVRATADAERELAVLRAVSHPHVVRLHQGVVLDDGRLALVLDLIDGPTLAAVVAQRGHLSPGEVVTLMVPLAQAVADLHADGVQHGDLAPGNVLLDRTGRPVLADLGTPRITGEPRDEVFGTAGYVDPMVLVGGRADAMSDVYGLGALAWLALTGAPPESASLRVPLAELAPAAPAGLVEAIEAAVDPDPARRPDPATLATALHAACEPVPVWISGAGPEAGGLTHRIRVLAAGAAAQTETGRRHRARRMGHRRLPAAGLGLLAAALACVGWVWVGPVGPARPKATVAPADSQRPAAAATTARPATAKAASVPSTAAAAATPGLAEAERVVAELAVHRARLFADPALAVTAVAMRGSPAAAVDEQAVRVLRRQGLAYRGLRLRTGRVRVIEAAPRRMVVDVVTTASSYDVVDRAGATVGHAGATPGQPARLVLALTGGGWRVQAVLSRP